MNILFIMIPLAIVLVVVAVFFFFWAANNKQFDDLDSPAYRILLDDDHDAVMMQGKQQSAVKQAKDTAEKADSSQDSG